MTVQLTIKNPPFQLLLNSISSFLDWDFETSTLELMKDELFLISWMISLVLKTLYGPYKEDDPYSLVSTMLLPKTIKTMYVLIVYIVLLMVFASTFQQFYYLFPLAYNASISTISEDVNIKSWRKKGWLVIYKLIQPIQLYHVQPLKERKIYVLLINLKPFYELGADLRNQILTRNNALLFSVVK